MDEKKKIYYKFLLHVHSRIDLKLNLYFKIKADTY